MRITIDKDDGSREVFQDVTDYALVVRNWRPGMREGKPNALLVTQGYSHHSGGLRELVKEIRQTEVEMQAALDEWIAQSSKKG